MARSDYTISARFCPDSFVAGQFASRTRFWKVGDETRYCNVTFLRSAMFSSATFENPTTKILACQSFLGNRMTYTLLTWGNHAPSCVREPHEQLELTRSVYQLTSLHYAEYTVTTTKMNTINSKKKNANKENERRWNNIMETTLFEMWQQRPCIFDVFTKEIHDRVKRDTAWWKIADTLDLRGKFGAISCWRANSYHNLS